MVRRCISILLLFVMGCSAKMVVRPGRPGTSKFAPVNEAQRPGIIKYRNDGIESVRLRRREDAYRQMSEACSGRYKILDESVGTQDSVSTDEKGVTTVSNTEFVLIKFECVNN